ncbi:MAG: hypothetical protein RR322_02840 [Oscillospiraceae bacterium]
MASTFPAEIDNIPQFQNILQSDAPNVKLFQDAIQKGDFATASAIFNQIPNANNKFFGAVKMNQVGDAVIALEQFYGTDIQPYIFAKQTEWQNIINLFSYIGTYNIATQYSKNNIVLFNDSGLNQLYINIFNGNTPINTQPTNTTYWRVFTVRGSKGDNGSGTTFFQFQWNSTANYVIGDIVVFNNSWWIATRPNANKQPSEGSADWNLIMSVTQAIYPIQPNQPLSQTIGEIWFREVS